MPARLRPFRRDDLDAVVRLSIAAWEPVFASFRQILGPEIYMRLYPDWHTSQTQGVAKVCTQRGTIVWVAEVDEVVVGFVAYRLHRQKKVGTVELLAVHPAHQNRGIGTQLNRVALDQMHHRGMELAEVSTGGDPAHAPARRAYEKAGYTALPLARYYKALQSG